MYELKNLIRVLENQSSAIMEQDRPISSIDAARVKSIHQAMYLVRSASELFDDTPEQHDNFVTYKIVSDLDGKLKTAARTSCNFWNRFIAPRFPIVIRLGVFTANSRTIARAYKPYERNGTRFGVIEFNTKYLGQYDANGIAGTVVHEIGHTLGYGWDHWMNLFHRKTGKFKAQYIQKLPELQNMRVETDYGSGTRYSHWDEELFDGELMTGFKDSGEYVLPVTIDVLALFDHQSIERLEAQTDLAILLEDVSNIAFSRKDEAEEMDVDYYEKTEIFEEIPHPK